jgi:Family of unknown function (DUF5995)
VRRRIGRGLVLTAVAVLLLVAPARAANISLPNWPSILPANPNNSSATVPLDFDVCPGGEFSCPAEVIEEMIERWQPLDASCDHRAVFALTYLRTTQEFFRTVTENPNFSSDPAWLNHEDAVFAELYFNAYDDWVAGRPVPPAWRIAFQTAATGSETGAGDLLLGMNAHISRDLPFTLAHVGLVKPDGSTRKPDHDRVNEFLDRVADPLQDELGALYDPIFPITDLEPSPLDEITLLQIVRGMRELAWRNAERLVNAKTAFQRANVAVSIERQSASFARIIRLTQFVPGWGPFVRDPYCVAHH